MRGPYYPIILPVSLMCTTHNTKLVETYKELSTILVCTRDNFPCSTYHFRTKFWMSICLYLSVSLLNLSIIVSTPLSQYSVVGLSLTNPNSSRMELIYFSVLDPDTASINLCLCGACGNVGMHFNIVIHSYLNRKIIKTPAYLLVFIPVLWETNR